MLLAYSPYAQQLYANIIVQLMKDNYKTKLCGSPMFTFNFLLFLDDGYHCGDSRWYLHKQRRYGKDGESNQLGRQILLRRTS